MVSERNQPHPGGVAPRVDLASLQVTYRQLRQPAWLLRRLAHWLVPPRAWTIRPVDPGAANASWQAGRLLAYGRMWGRRSGARAPDRVTLHGPGADGSTCSATGPSTRST